VDAPRFERILQEQFARGEPVREWIVARNALGCSGTSGSGD
jgi:hypothetical protein